MRQPDCLSCPSQVAHSELAWYISRNTGASRLALGLAIAWLQGIVPAQRFF